MIRVAQVAPNIFPVPPEHHGGTERVIHDLGTALSGLGVEVTLFAPSDSATDLPHVGDHPSLSALERRHGRVAPGVPAALDALQLEALRLRLDRFDIVHCHGEFAHAALLGARRRHSLTTVHWRVDELDRALFFAGFPDLPVAAISAAQEAGIPAANRAGIVHHGIARDRYALQTQPAAHVAFVGRMTDQKRPDTAIRVARAAGIPIRLGGTIDVGNPDYFEHRVRPLLGDDATYLGPVDDRRKGELLGDARALLFPIDWPEPFGLVMIEAMACGTPVVAWNRGSVPEIVEDGVTGFIVSSEAEAVAALGRIEQIDRAQVRARFEARFTAERMAADYLALYRRLLAA
ncbi:glycosyltransferase family 4 protein [Methylobacterium sp. WL30]|uniref:glycosyltransferase family 4 protein n=1 Tax=unclassified Methylobacterium TaxID=2615210 RepID=UPI0011CB4F81|nr:glycosyltransferase family 4 protein [Methylobacterium sp. WL93]TXN50295.1 glycosyltransferase family 4 protein [Methylobacterium sp. WL119]TXN68023.1 glycosyltransferase family 4 protein [Methylobacterium sp. WL30]